MLAGHDARYIHVIWLVASTIGAAVLVALVLIYRCAARRHELEEVERVIAEHDQSD
jgi:hypothetical protein